MSNLSQLHETDLNLWLETTIQKIQDKNYEAMDWSNLIEELEDMGASQKRALESYTCRLIEHLLKLNYWQAERKRCARGWKSEINTFRNSIQRLLEKNPSLRKYQEEQYDKLFVQSLESMRFQFDLPDEVYFPLDKALDKKQFDI